MTDQTSTAAPYTVFVDVPYYFTYLISGRGNVSFLNKGLRPGQLESFNLYGSKTAFVLAAFFSSILTWLFSTTIVAAVLIPTAFSGGTVGIAIGATAAVVLIAAATWATIHMDRLGTAAEDAIVEMKEQGAIASVPDDERFKDLRRISRAIQYLQAEHGSRYDEQARKAVVAVIEQNRHQPDEKHVTIAHSDAMDDRSKAIRVRTMEAMKAWRRDVANTEQLILTLEEAAGIRTAETV